MTAVDYNKIWILLKNNSFFPFNDSINQELICSICNNIMKNACNSVCCCKYCLECIRNYLNGQERYCPNLLEDCKEQTIDLDQDIQINHAINKKISQLIVKCPFDHCLIKDRLRNMYDHIGSHKIDCPYLEIGCSNNIQMNRYLLNEHLYTDNYSHSKLLVESFNNMKNEMAFLMEDLKKKEVKISYMMEKTKKLKIINDNYQSEVEKLKINIKQRENENQKDKEKHDKENQSIDIIKLKSGKYQSEIFKKLNHMEREKINLSRLMKEIIGIENRKEQGSFTIPLAISDNKTFLGEIRIGKLIFTSSDVEEKRYYLPVRWSVSPLQKIRHYAKILSISSYKSFPMYSAKKGYKLKIVVFGNGTGSGLNTHLSIGFHIMKGEYDHLLSWPMPHKVTLSIMFININRPFLSKSFDCKSYKNIARFMRPTEEMNASIGKPKFISFLQLFNEECIYQNDQIFVRCSIDD